VLLIPVNQSREQDSVELWFLDRVQDLPEWFRGLQL
jgi:predicted AAA+ superfamily ATPase